MNRPPLSSVANLPPTSNISAAFQGCSFQGYTINIIQKKPEFNPEEKLRDVNVNDYLMYNNTLMYYTNCSLVRSLNLSAV